MNPSPNPIRVVLGTYTDRRPYAVFSADVFNGGLAEMFVRQVTLVHTPPHGPPVTFNFLHTVRFQKPVVGDEVLRAPTDKKVSEVVPGGSARFVLSPRDVGAVAGLLDTEPGEVSLTVKAFEYPPHRVEGSAVLAALHDFFRRKREADAARANAAPPRSDTFPGGGGIEDPTPRSGPAGE